MSRKGQSITLSVSERDKVELENLQREFVMMWGDRSNISKLVEAIAQHQLLIGNNNDSSESCIDRIMILPKASPMYISI